MADRSELRLGDLGRQSADDPEMSPVDGMVAVRTASELVREGAAGGAAGVPTENDARLLLAHVLGEGPFPWWNRFEVAPRFAGRFAELIAMRAERIPLQHLTGKAYFGRLELDVGPGVFIPRPETERMMVWATSS